MREFGGGGVCGQVTGVVNTLQPDDRGEHCDAKKQQGPNVETNPPGADQALSRYRQQHASQGYLQTSSSLMD